MALEPRVDQRVDEGDEARAAAVLAVARDVPADADLEARAFGPGEIDADRDAEGVVERAVRAQWRGDPPGFVDDWLAGR